MTPTPVTGSVFARDLVERAVATFVTAVIPFALLALQATDLSDLKALGLSALGAGLAAVLTMIKALAAQRLTGTASLSQAVSVASTAVPPTQPHPATEDLS